jgi:hypothetical protein
MSSVCKITAEIADTAAAPAAAAHAADLPWSELLQAELLAGPDSVTAAWQQLQYPHITLMVGPGAAAADSNLLPARVADAGDAAACRVMLPEPLLVTGQVLAFM